ncbi:MAG: hypothetical protein V1913_08675 [Fibrobacterota bacterium]
MKKTIILALMLTAGTGIFAQESPGMVAQDTLKERVTNIEGKVTGIDEAFLEAKATLEKLAKIKVSGYIQAQYRMAMDTAGSMDTSGKYYNGHTLGSYSGGTFADGVQSQFHVRRGRMKLTYEQPLTFAVLQFDVTQSGVGMKDAYLAMKEPFFKTAALKLGVFDRPFGFEIGYSSSSRETPERSRLFQILFPGERDLGAQLEVQFPEKQGMLSWLNLKGGLFNGTGIAVENDDNKDFIGRLGFSIPLTGINLAIDGGFSTYMGKVRCTDTTQSRIDTSTRSVETRGFTYEMDNKQFKKSDSAITQLNKDFERKYMGADLQVYYDLPVIGGLSLRGEFIQGVQPGTSSSSGFYNPGRNSTQPVYVRNFSGYYLMVVQNVFLRNQLVLKYDVYDPNTDVEGKDITNTTTTKLSVADLKYTTIGVGLVHHWDENLKFVLYYDKVENEAAAFNTTDANDKKYTTFNGDLSDNVLTLRAQYKF